MMRSGWRHRSRGAALAIAAILGFGTVAHLGSAGQQGAPAGAAGGQAPAGNQQDGFRVDPSRGPVDLMLMDPALVGAIDIHLHLVPDSPGANGNVRAIDAFQMAQLAKARGMRGFVPKTQHDLSSVAIAYLVRKYGTPGVEVFG